jgi:hypothetical protein
VWADVEEVSQDKQFDRKDVIFSAIDSMLNGADEKDFTADGKPDARKLSALAGFTVDSNERNTMWDAYIAAQQTKPTASATATTGTGS